MRNVKNCLAMLLVVMMIISLCPATVCGSSDETPTAETALPETPDPTYETSTAEPDFSEEDLTGLVGEAELEAEGEEVSDDADEPLVGASTLSYKLTFQYRQKEARSMLDMVNSFRTGSDAWYWDSDNTTKVVCSDLSELTYDYQLEKIAMIRAMEIVVLYSHTRPNGSSARTALNESGYAWTSRGENLALGQRTAKAAYTAWREDNEDYSGQGHRRVMLYKKFNRIGIGHVYYNGVHYWSQVFAKSDGTITETAANNSTTTATVSLSDEYIVSAKGSASVDLITVGVNKSCDLPEVTLTLKTEDPTLNIDWTNTVSLVPNCTWTSEDSSIAVVESGGQDDVATGSTTTGGATSTGSTTGSGDATGSTTGSGASTGSTTGSGDATGSTTGSGTSTGNATILRGVSIGSTSITTTVNGVTITVPVTVIFEPLVVGDDVTAQIVFEDSSCVLYFSSQDGTLWNNWKTIVGSMLSSVSTIKMTSDSGKMYLPADSSSLFSGLGKLESVDFSNVDSSKVTNASALFSQCSSLAVLDLSGWDLSFVSSQTNAIDLFNDCTSLATINTPRKTNANVNVMLPAAFVDDNGNKYVRLPVNASDSIKISKWGDRLGVHLSKCTVTLRTTRYTYTGTARKPGVTVTHSWNEETVAGDSTVSVTAKKATLVWGTDFEVTFANNTNVGTATATITGKGNYAGTVRKTFKIVQAAPTLKFARSSISKTDLDKAFTNTLTQKTDGTVRFKSGNRSVATVNSRTGKVTIKGVGTAIITATAAAGKNYKAGSVKYTLKVVKKEIVPVYRLFNTRTGEHFYTASASERKQYLDAGNWASEGIAWYAPKKSSQPIYRLSNPNNGNEHHYTKSKSEKDWLVSIGWKYDKIAWYSDTDKLIPIYRHYHPTQRTGNHHYTTSKGESDYIVKYEGWKFERISFYVSKAGG